MQLKTCFLLLVILQAFLVNPVLPKSIAGNKIKHVIVLMEENRSFDHMFGWYPGVNGLTGNEYNVVNASIPDSKRIYVDKLEPMVAPCDPDHGTPGTTFKIFGAIAYQNNDTTNATMSGFVEWESKRGNEKTNYCDVMSMLTPQHLPIMSTLASEFAVMDRFFAAYPGPTWPNRIFTLSGTSAGLTETGPWYHDKDGKLFPQPTIFDQLNKEGLTWRNYYNDTPWELFIEGLAHNPDSIASLEQFFVDAKEGNLPSFAWINPRSGVNLTLGQGSSDQHPDHDVALGEQYYKDIYEALRASPQWNETLFIITYDEHGGYFDHVPTPLNVPPPGDGEPSYPDKDVKFDRLGVRIPCLLISPWIPAGLVVSEPPKSQKPAANSEFSLTSIIATVRILLGMQSGPLTDRDAWSATFDHVLNLTEPRTDCPMHLPAPLPPANDTNTSAQAEALRPVNDLQKHIMTVHAHLAGAAYPHHVKLQGDVGTWAQTHYRKHASHTKLWKVSKEDPALNVVCRVGRDKGWAGMSWTVNKATSDFLFTISYRNSNNTLCLAYTKDADVVLSLCYPSWNPDTNRDPHQQWIWEQDATVRPYADPSLCLTTEILNGDEKVYVKKCQGPMLVTQHWSYNGGAPGNSDSGTIEFSAYNLGVVNATASAVIA